MKSHHSNRQKDAKRNKANANMANTKNHLHKHYQHKAEHISPKDKGAIYAWAKHAINVVFGYFGSLFRINRGPQYINREFSHNVFHSPHGRGKRTEEQRQERKARRQKRQRLIMRRGYA